MRVPGEVYAGEPLREIAAQSAALLRGQFDDATSSFLVELAPLPESQRRGLTNANEKPGAPLQIGVERTVPPRFRGAMRSSNLDWIVTPDGGMAATFTVRSPGAVATRVALRMAQVPAGVQVRFFNAAQPGQSFGPYGRDEFRAQAHAAMDAGGAPGPYWSPVVGGDTLGVEIYVRRRAQRDRLEFSIEGVAHLLYSPKYSDPEDIVGVKASQSCEIDLACKSSWQSAGNAVARIVFQDGGTFLCTGQLMSDADPNSTIPYFSTATHCVGNQGAAGSINFFWFDQRTGCGGGGTTTQQTSGGATLLSASGTNSGTDFSFMRLNQSPPGGVSFLGWDTGTVGLGAAITGIHHPAGDVKKISQGTLSVTSGTTAWKRPTDTRSSATPTAAGGRMPRPRRAGRWWTRASASECSLRSVFRCTCATPEVWHGPSRCVRSGTGMRAPLRGLPCRIGTNRRAPCTVLVILVQFADLKLVGSNAADWNKRIFKGKSSLAGY